MRRIAIAAPVIALAIPACVIISTHGDRFDRAGALRHTADDVIVPGYRDVDARAGELSGALQALCASPDASTVGEARAAYREAVLAWDEAAAWSFGPAVDLGLAGEIDFLPTRPATIEANVAATEPITDASIDVTGAAAKGLPAIEYLLYAPEGDDAAILAALGAERRCGYLAALGRHVARKTRALLEAWEGGQADALATAGPGSAVYSMQADAYSAIVTQLVSTVQRLKLSRLGRPIGYEDGLAHPDEVELPYAGFSVAAMIATLEGVRAVFRATLDDAPAATEPPSLDGFVRSRDPALAARVLSEIDAAIEALRAIPEPLDDYARGADHTAGDVAYEAVRAIERTLATDVSSTIAITVAFTDNDGD